MPNKNILAEDVQAFIEENLNADLHKLILKKPVFPGITMQELAAQIHGRRTAQKKYPFLSRSGILHPAWLSTEQASSEAAARYKSNIAGSGELFADLTTGFGIDAWFISQKFRKAILVEQNGELLCTVAHNWQILGREARFVNTKLEDFIDETQEHFDLIYLDPARRDKNKKKVFHLEDMSPNILEIQGRLSEISERILIKLSPLTDLALLKEKIINLAEIHIVALKNDVKEVLALCRKNAACSDVSVFAADLADDTVFSFLMNEEAASQPEYSSPQKYIYLPNNALLKTGAWGAICKKFTLKKLHPNTQIFTSEELLEEFPGRILEMKTISPKEIPKGGKFNIISKNYPLTPDEIRKKYKIKDGGDEYLIFTKTLSEKIILQSV